MVVNFKLLLPTPITQFLLGSNQKNSTYLRLEVHNHYIFAAEGRTKEQFLYPFVVCFFPS